MADCRKTHDLVKRAYGEVARKQASCCDSKALKSCCSGGEAPKVPEADLGLSCGNPVAFSEIKPGDVVVDLGSGAGRDVFLAADYSQIELRVLAHLSKDSELRRAFQENRDIHSQTAARIFGTPSEMVTEEMRSQAKVINFGILYGMGPHRLSRELSISHAQAGAFIEEYFRAYPAVREWIDKTIEEARKTGYVTTLSGRRRMIANMNSSNHNLRSNAERMAVNTPVQGTAADMVKFAMIALHQEIESSGRRARMVLQVHDELVFSLPEEEVKEFEPVVRERMQEALPLDVPLRVDTKTGKTWAEC